MRQFKFAAIFALFITVSFSAEAQQSLFTVNQVTSTATTTTLALNNIDPTTGRLLTTRQFTVPFGQAAVIGNPVIDAEANTIVVRTHQAGQSDQLHTYNLKTGKLVSSVTSPTFNGELAALYNAPSSADTTTNTAAIASHDSRISSLEDKTDLLSYRIEELDDKIGRVGAMAAALNIQRPLDGKKFRVGMDVGFYDGKTAIGIAGSTVAGNVDIGGGVAFTGGEVMGKAGVGFNW